MSRLKPRSRLARALWIEIIVLLWTIRPYVGRGSREPCGLKFRIYYCHAVLDIVEARESLVD